MNIDSNIYIAGHAGMVGSAIVRKLQAEGYKNIITKTRNELDLVVQNDVFNFFQNNKIDYVFLCAAKVGGIVANNNDPASFLLDNMNIQNNIISSAAKATHPVKKLVFLGSSCIYPKYAEQPIKEESLLTGPLEPTNEGYALAKITGLKLCQYYKKYFGHNFISVMPTNLYGINDNYHETNSHVIPGLINKIHKAKIANDSSVTIWGSGKPKREFLFVDDLAESLYFLIKRYNGLQHINIGTGKDITIAELAKLISKVIGFKGELRYDTIKLDGTPRKLLDVSKMTNLGWTYKTELEDGLKIAYEDYLNGQ